MRHLLLFLWLLSLCPSFSDAFFIPRVSLKDFLSSPVFDKPFVIEEALDVDDCDQWLQHLWTRSKNEQIDVERGSSRISTVMSLEDAADKAVHESTHEDALYASSIGSSCSTDQLPLYDLLDSICQDHDWFTHFSQYVPIHDTLVVAGNGASSKLCFQPFTKFSMCIDGNQLWRVLPPSTTKMSPVALESIEVKTWDEYTLNTGYQSSKHSLFEFRHRHVFWADDEEEGDCVNELDEFDKYDDFQIWGDDEEMLRPNLPITNEDWQSAITITGDLLVIPPGWWHQSYNLDNSVSILSQRCNSHCATGLVQHILATSDLEASDFIRQYDDNEAKNVVDSLFSLLEEKNVM